MNGRIMLVAAAAIAIAGCSTPKIALDHANNGVALTAGLQRELRAYEVRQSSIDTLRLRVIATERQLASDKADSDKIDDQLRSMSGAADKLTAQRQLRDVADLRSKLAADALLAKRQSSAALMALLRPLPPVQQKIGTTQKALADLGVELGFSERLSLVTTFLKDVRAEIDSNKQAADALAQPK